MGLNGSEWRTRAFNGVSSGTYTIIQNPTFATITVNSISNTNAGFQNTGSGDYYIIFWRAGQ
jgi:hypothetical protein